ncbi:MAG TPA: DUF2938 domain-containing protein [Steroidobacteraceae bacterium]|jgi:hypothetical protein|nr:DUF2938 domain-containing protein [Steroidobacteraceae bacterium]
MSSATETLLHVVAIGVGATAVMDIWGALQSRLFGARPMSYALVGRWLAHMLLRGRVRHDAIAAAPPVRGEHAVGWIAHYVIGIAFAAVLVVLWGIDWARSPSLAPALIVGIATVVFPFLILQPAFGLGVAAARAPNPNQARLRSLLTHTVFGLGLYVVARLIELLHS